MNESERKKEKPTEFVNTVANLMTFNFVMLEFIHLSYETERKKNI